MPDTGIAAVYDLEDDEKALVERVVSSEVPEYHPESYESFMSGCRLAATHLPANIHLWGNRVRQVDVGLVRNLPVDVPMPSTPIRHQGEIYGSTVLSDRVVGTLSALFGTIYTIEGKAQGRHIHNIHPVIGDEYTQLGSSSKVNLDWHVEEAFHRFRPCWLSLFCLRGNPEAVTKVARFQDLRFPPGFIKNLRKCRVRLRIDETYDSTVRPSFVTSPIVTGPSDNPQIVLDPAYTISENQTENEVIAEIISAAERTHQRFALAKGDFLVFNNLRVIHARTPFCSPMDGSDRWLKRVFILEPSKAKLKNGLVPFEDL